MSTISSTIATCPRCGAGNRVRLFNSLNAERVAAQRALIVDGSFELLCCDQCEHRFQPEHRMLLAEFTRGLWIVMQPRDTRPRFATIEHGVERVFAEQFAAAPPAVAAGVRGIRPRLVFGQDMLTEALRCADAHLEPALLECAKMLALRRDLARLIRLGPVELIFEHFDPDGGLVHRAVSLVTRTPLDTVVLPGTAIAEARDEQPSLRERFPDLFLRPYVSACRYLYGATV